MSRFVQIKTVVVGEGGAGKTNLIEHLTRRRFDPARLATYQYDRAEMWLELSGEGDVAIVDLWDTAGQESARKLVNTFYRGSHMCLIVYDVCNRQSFRGVNWWYGAYMDENPPGVTKFTTPNIAIIGTQCDVGHLREVTTEEGRDLAVRLGVPYFGETTSVDQQKCSDVDHIIAKMSQATFHVLNRERQEKETQAEEEVREYEASFTEISLDDELPHWAGGGRGRREEEPPEEALKRPLIQEEYTNTSNCFC